MLGIRTPSNVEPRLRCSSPDADAGIRDCVIDAIDTAQNKTVGLTYVSIGSDRRCIKEASYGDVCLGTHDRNTVAGGDRGSRVGAEK